MLLGEDAHVPPWSATRRPPVVLAKSCVLGESAGQEAEGQRSVYHHPYALLQEIGKHLLLHAPVKHVETVLHHLDPPGGRAFLDLAQVEIGHPHRAHLPLLNDAVQRMHGLVEGRGHVGPVNQQHIQVICLEVPQALLDGGHDGDQPAIPALGPVRVADATFGNHHNVLAARTQRLPQCALRLSSSVGGCGVKAIDTQVYGAVHRGDNLGFANIPIGAAHLPTTEAQNRHRDVCPAEHAVFHYQLPPMPATCEVSYLRAIGAGELRSWPAFR